ncbi:MAG: hypothetical protein DCC51_16205 [Anaerolineae bacterium]|nr:MAG: hypothetical protein DCC51_16205 [Anaerolineae bacterium]
MDGPQHIAPSIDHQAAGCSDPPSGHAGCRRRHHPLRSRATRITRPIPAERADRGHSTRQLRRGVSGDDDQAGSAGFPRSGEFTQVAGKDDVAIVAGRNRDQSVVNRLKHLQARDARIRVLDGYIPVDEMQRYLLAADVMVAPFEKVLTSSSVILGLTFGLPVIAPALGCLPELITDEAGILYRPSDPAALSQALVNIKSEDIAAMGAAARRIADGLKWDDIGRRTASAYEKCLRS